MVLDIGRTQVMAYRAAAQGLDRATADPAKLGVFDLGVQDTTFGTARLALAARLPEPLPGGEDPLADEETFALLWSVRGAPHVHRRADLPGLARALWPRSEADATARLAAERKALKAAGIPALDAFTAAAQAVRAVVTKPLGKGDVSAAVTARLPDAYAYDCRGCRARHVYGGLFQLVGLPAGVRHEPDTSPPILAPLEGRPPIPTSAKGVGAFIRAYLRLHGPATLAEAASYLGTSQAALRPEWPDGLAEVTVDGRRTWLPEDQLDALRAAPSPAYVRLLPTYDPFVQSRDRDLLVPDPARQKELWRILGSPGALIVNGEIAGTWRARAAGKKRLTVTVQAFGSLPRAVRAAVEDEAARMARVRGMGEAAVTYADT
ncbi:winged helix DNA-binding domain-containing protein [Actinopolymorpha alba]|uniref:winged helix DNA-binding domain-containing protein n=1 Tax=Actinopolymorpha alba TaxID=533267 RepID=UPI00036BA490|nr:winged helix DNA-binding domain-containing protein [Actinopolymorpha alba]